MHRSSCRISVIVPAYNAAPYLQRCYESVCAQAIADWELLLIENGSTDNTSAIGEQLAQQDSRVRLLHSDKGVCVARNRGIAEARGEFVTFLDADDRLLPDAFEVFLRAAQANPACEIIIGGTDGINTHKRDAVYEGTQIEEARVHFLRHPTRYLTVWGKLYRTDFLQQSAVRFDETLTHAEDSDYFLRLLADCRALAIIRTPVYHYTARAFSTVRGQTGLVHRYCHSLQTTARCFEKDCLAVRKAFNFYVLDNLLVLLVHDVFRKEKSARAQRLDAAAVLAMPVFRDALDNAALNEASVGKRLAYAAAKHNRLHLLQAIIRVRQWQNRHRR